MSSQAANLDRSVPSATDGKQFVDYIRSPEVKVLPPAKYKLWFIVFVLVYFASWVSAEAKLREFLEFNGGLSFHASLFLQLAITVFVLVYAAIDLFQTCLTFQTKDGKLYGVVAWLKQPRARWMYRHENFFFETAARIVHILEDGFAMLDAPPVKTMSKAPQQFDCQDGACQTTLKIEHRIKNDRLDDYGKWVERIRKSIKQFNGIDGVEREEIREDSDEEEGAHAEEATAKDKPYLAVIYVKCKNIDYLNDWMMCPRRKALMDQLEPLLSRPDVVQIEKDRDLPDAFSDLLTRQGNSVPKSPPRKWKVWWLTLLALYVTIRWSMSFLPYYMDLWGVSDQDIRLQRLVELFIVTFLVSYVMAPLFLFLFDHWLQQDFGQNKHQPWKCADRGFESIWLKVALAFAFYGGCVIAILVKRYA